MNLEFRIVVSGSFFLFVFYLFLKGEMSGPKMSLRKGEFYTQG